MELRYDKHIFICVNERLPGGKPSCGEKKGLELVAAFKKEIAARNLPIRVRAQKAGCLDVCFNGPSVAVYPDGIFYGNVQLSDVVEIVNTHIVGGLLVERLIVQYDSTKP